MRFLMLSPLFSPLLSGGCSARGAVCRRAFGGSLGKPASWVRFVASPGGVPLKGRAPPAGLGPQSRVGRPSEPSAEPAPSWQSGRRVLNPRPSTWEADALPTELRPRSRTPGHLDAALGPKLDTIALVPPEREPPQAAFHKRGVKGAPGRVAWLSASNSGLPSRKSHRSPKPVSPADAVKDASPPRRPPWIWVRQRARLRRVRGPRLPPDNPAPRDACRQGREGEPASRVGGVTGLQNRCLEQTPSRTLAPPKAVSSYMVHSSITVTLEGYGHRLAGSEPKAAACGRGVGPAVGAGEGEQTRLASNTRRLGRGAWLSSDHGRRRSPLLSWAPEERQGRTRESESAAHPSS